MVELKTTEDNKEFYDLEYMDVGFTNPQDVFRWILDNKELIYNRKILLDLDYMLDEDYFNVRIKDRHKYMYLVKREKDAIITTANVVQSVPIDCSDYKTYKNQVCEVIFN